MHWIAAGELDSVLVAERYDADILGFERRLAASPEDFVSLQSLCAPVADHGGEVIGGWYRAAVGSERVPIEVQSGSHAIIESDPQSVALISAAHVRSLLSRGLRPGEVKRIPIESIPDWGRFPPDTVAVVVQETRIYGLNLSRVPFLSLTAPVGQGIVFLRPRVGVPPLYLEAALASVALQMQWRLAKVGTRSLIGPLDVVWGRDLGAFLRRALVPRPSSKVGAELLQTAITLRPHLSITLDVEDELPRFAGVQVDPIATRRSRSQGGPYSSPRLLAPSSIQDAVRNAIAIAAHTAPAGFLEHPIGEGIYLMLEHDQKLGLVSRRAELIDCASAESVTRTLALSEPFAAKPFLVGEQVRPTLLNASWATPLDGIVQDHLLAPELITAVAGIRVSADSEELERIRRFARAAEAISLPDRIAAERDAFAIVEQTRTPGAALSPHELIPRVWKRLIHGAPEGADGISRIAAASREIVDIIGDVETFGRMTLACYEPLLLVGVASAEGSLVALLLVPLAPLARVEADLQDFLVVLYEEIARQMDHHRQIQRDIARRVVSRASHLLKNPVGLIQIDLQRLADHARHQPWAMELAVPAVRVDQMERLGHDRTKFTVAGIIGELENHLERVDHALSRMSQYFRGDRGPATDIDVNAALRRSVRGWGGQRSDVELSWCLDDRRPMARMPHRDLDEILENILGNGNRHMPPLPGRRYELRFKSLVEPPYVVIEIRNDGEGELPNNATEPYVTSDPDRGTGLGLAVVRQNAELAGGRFVIFRNSDGPGVTNRITLPLGEIAEGGETSCGLYAY